jgi:hypothetical protein
VWFGRRSIGDEIDKKKGCEYSGQLTSALRKSFKRFSTGLTAKNRRTSKSLKTAILGIPKVNDTSWPK